MFNYKLNSAPSIILVCIFLSACASKGSEDSTYEVVKTSAKADEKSYNIWYFVSKVDREIGYRVYVAKESILIENDERNSWSKLIFDEEQKDSDGAPYKEVYIYSTINCSNGTYSYVASRFYNSLGELVHSENISQDPLPIMANTVSDHVAKFVCAYSAN
jgi:hypothetical protein